MNLARLKCILTGGCKFSPDMTTCHVDENDICHIEETCINCGKKFTYDVPLEALEQYAEEIHLLNSQEQYVSNGSN